MKKKCRVEVIDSEWATMAEGFIVMKATKAAKAGASLNAVIEIARKTMLRVDFLCTFDTLEYLMTPAIGTHTGPGLLLVAILGDKK